MAQLVDNLIAFRVLSMLVTPFEKTKAYKLGLIDQNGSPQKKIKDMSYTEKDAYTMLHRLTFRLRKIMQKIPLLNTKIGNLAAAYFLVRECINNSKSSTNLEEQYIDILTKIQKEDIMLVDEYLLVEKFLNEDVMGTGGLPANHTGAGVKTDEPVIRKNSIKKYQMLARRKMGNVAA
jgi:hypothetical protein